MAVGGGGADVGSHFRRHRFRLSSKMPTAPLDLPCPLACRPLDCLFASHAYYHHYLLAVFDKEARPARRPVQSISSRPYLPLSLSAADLAAVDPSGNSPPDPIIASALIPPPIDAGGREGEFRARQDSPSPHACLALKPSAVENLT